MMHGCSDGFAVAQVWKAEGSFVESVLFVHFPIGSGDQNEVSRLA